MIHIFGDSHASSTFSGWGKCDNVISHHLGGILCYSFGKEKLKRCNISDFNLNDNDSVIFCFGEIDCRNHVHKHINQTNTYVTIIDNIVNNYFDAINENINSCKIKLKHISVYNVIPPITYREEAPNHPFPYLGTDEERKMYVQYFNKQVENKCKENNFIFFDIYDEVKNSEGFLKKELSDDNCHLKSGTAMKQFIEKNFLLQKSEKKQVKLKDNNCSHEPSFFQDSENISFVRNLNPYSNGDLQIENGDVVIYTNSFQNKIDPKARINIALMMEGQEYNRSHYDYISANNNKFDLVLTFDKTLLDRGENFKLNLYGTCWLHDNYIKIWNKTKICSMVTSNKKVTSGHKFRHVITDYISKNNVDIDIYGGNYKVLPYMTSKNFAPDHGGRHITNRKIKALKDYMFSITIENSKEDYCFTEKIIDCFLTGTIPIYYGCPSIGKFFNINGIIMIDTISDLTDVLQNINVELYNKMKPYIEENYNTAQKYKSFKINEDAILEIITSLKN